MVVVSFELEWLINNIPIFIAILRKLGPLFFFTTYLLRFAFFSFQGISRLKASPMDGSCSRRFTGKKKTRLTLLAFGRGRLLAPKMLSIAFVQMEI